jgi:hypothetical protein
MTPVGLFKQKLELVSNNKLRKLPLRFDRSDRFITFIILGVALLLVSYLYTRYYEAIRRYWRRDLNCPATS